jgi:hypothetical protein
MWVQQEKGYIMVKDWEQQDKDALYDWLSGMLKEGTVSLTFEKKDGSIREMNATLKEGVVVPYEKKSDKEKKVSREVMAVFDVDKSEWRSFRLDSLKEIRGSL